MTELLYDKLTRYAAGGVYPFHMPGHKRRLFSMCDPYRIDITEIDGFDDLHHPEGILQAAQAEAAQIYRARTVYFLVNGSTCGILSAIAGCVPVDGKLLMARNCHKSVLNAVFERRLQPVDLYPQPCGLLPLNGAVAPEEVRQRLAEEPGIQAVMITSPTYEGVVSDVAEIARITHACGVPLIVDEAHGAHFSFGSAAGFPQSAVELGADFVIQSLHKTLPSLTQTAVLLVGAGASDALQQRVERFVHLYQSSSPSYVLLSSIQNCIVYMDGQGRAEMPAYQKRLAVIREQMAACRNFWLLEKKASGSIFALDPGKLVFGVRGRRISGRELARRLLEEFQLQMEMSTEDYVIAMTSLLDSEAGLQRLVMAVRAIDAELESKGEEPAPEADQPEPDLPETDLGLPRAVRLLTPYAAEMAPHRAVAFSAAAGETAAEPVYLYPPGIALLMPGEQIQAAALDKIREWQRLGFSVQGCHDGLLTVVAEAEHGQEEKIG